MGFAINKFIVPLVFCVLQFVCAGLGLEQVPCLFMFGDSLVDNGNNNDLATEAKVDYAPYGVDYPQGPTGRFTNGRNTADILAKLLGFEKSVPPFATAQGQDVIKGVNYASGSAGIRTETGKQLGDNISIDKQLVNHKVTFSRISQLLGNDTSAKQHLAKCLYYFVVGSNDYLNNYYLPESYSTSTVYTPDEYAAILVQQYSQQLKTLYSYGARKVSVAGLGPLGCIPQSLARGTNGSACADSINDAVKLFNDKLKLLVRDLSRNLTDAEFIYNGAMALEPSDLFAIGLSIISKPCCKVSSRTGQCIKGQSPCPVRGLYAYYDNFHPTEIVNKVVATATYIDMLKLIL